MLTEDLCKPWNRALNKFFLSLNLICCRWGRQPCWKCLPNFYQTCIFGCLVVFKAFDYIIINESDCHLQQLYPLKTFQRNVINRVISQRQIRMADQKLYKYQKYFKTIERKKWQKFRNFFSLCCQILSKADKTGSCKFFMDIMWISCNYTTTIT